MLVNIELIDKLIKSQKRAVALRILALIILSSIASIFIFLVIVRFNVPGKSVEDWVIRLGGIFFPLLSAISLKEFFNCLDKKDILEHCKKQLQANDFGKNERAQLNEMFVKAMQTILNR